MATDEDRRTAVGISVTLSSQLMTAALGMLALIGAFVTFVLDKRIVGFWFWLALYLTSGCFAFSIFSGGRGINKARNAGYSGKWDVKVGKRCFNTQAILNMLGLMGCVILICVSHTSKEEESEKRITTIEAKLNDIESDLNTVKSRAAILERSQSKLELWNSEHFVIIPQPSMKGAATNTGKR